MIYILKRFDGKNDFISRKKFQTYEEAYEFLKKFYGDLCCSDSDYEDCVYYDITEIHP